MELYMNNIKLNPPIIKNNITFNFCQILTTHVNLGKNAIIHYMMLPTLENFGEVYEECFYTLTDDEYSQWKDDDMYIVYIIKRVIGFYK